MHTQIYHINPDLIRDPSLPTPSGFPIPDQVGDKLRGNDKNRVYSRPWLYPVLAMTFVTQSGRTESIQRSFLNVWAMPALRSR